MLFEWVLCWALDMCCSKIYNIHNKIIEEFPIHVFAFVRQTCIGTYIFAVEYFKKKKNERNIKQNYNSPMITIRVYLTGDNLRQNGGHIYTKQKINYSSAYEPIPADHSTGI